MAEKLFKTMVIASICFLATTGLSLACSYEMGTINNHLVEDGLLIGTIEGQHEIDLIPIIRHWESSVWEGRINDIGIIHHGFSPNSRNDNNDDIRNLFFYGLFNNNGNGHIWFGHIMFGRDWTNHYPNGTANGTHHNGGHWEDGLRGGAGDVAPVPEPATMLLLGTGLFGLAGLGRKKLIKH